mmetsp:Transcript_34352/g.80178  ORF Transcript_34352/g.80178 Transcript_34352/m.80178 type:complete len:216 (+) Transcript_34352:826-1473(+)
MASTANVGSDDGVLWSVPLRAVGEHLCRADPLPLKHFRPAADSVSGAVWTSICIYWNSGHWHSHGLGVLNVQHGALHGEVGEASAGDNQRCRVLRLRGTPLSPTGHLCNEGALLPERPATTPRDFSQSSSPAEDPSARLVCTGVNDPCLHAVYWDPPGAHHESPGGKWYGDSLQLRFLPKNGCACLQGGSETTELVAHRTRESVGWGKHAALPAQ